MHSTPPTCVKRIGVNLVNLKWAGVVSRMGKANIERLAAKVLRYRNIASILAFARRNRGSQGHGRHVHDGDGSPVFITMPRTNEHRGKC